MKSVVYKLMLSEPGLNKCSACARLKKDYLQKRAIQHERVREWLENKFGDELKIRRSDGKTGVILVEAREGIKTLLESAPEVIEVK